MEIYQTLILSALTTLIGIIVTDIVTRVKLSSKKAKEAKEQKTKEMMKSVVKEEMTEIKGQVKEIQEDTRLMRKANQAALRNSLYELFNICSKKGYATYNERDNFENLYENYHKLGANGVMDDIREKFLDLRIDHNNN